MSFFVEQVLNFGVPKEILVLILMLPVVASFIAFCRQIIGVRGLGIYITSTIAIAFVATKLKYGLVIFFVTIVSGTLFRVLLKKIRILYLPRMAMVISGVAFSIFLMFFLGSFLNIEGLQVISIFPILITILAVERFVAIQMERGAKMAIFLTLETLVLATLSYFIIGSQPLQKFLLDWPLLSFGILFIFNFFIGKWTGLRLTEYFRFRELMEYLEIPKK